MNAIENRELAEFVRRLSVRGVQLELNRPVAYVNRHGQRFIAIVVDLQDREGFKLIGVKRDSWHSNEYIDLRDAAEYPLVTRHVAWTMADGNTMAGEMRDRAFLSLRVTRVDGGSCTVDANDVRPATPDDIEAACQFFANIGR